MDDIYYNWTLSFKPIIPIFHYSIIPLLLEIKRGYTGSNEYVPFA